MCGNIRWLLLLLSHLVLFGKSCSTPVLHCPGRLPPCLQHVALLQVNQNMDKQKGPVQRTSKRGADSKSEEKK